ncbi:hypothetical protein [Teichococcus deserti]|nr:hypothetical protein [Pseudoroseomonas deserti]
MRLTEQKQEEVSRQVAAKASGRPEGGARAAAREIGVDDRAARRAAQVDSLSDAAKAVAREVGLDDNQSALLAAAAEKDSEAQAEKLREIKRRKEEREIIRKAGDAIVSHDANDEAAAD